MAYFHSEGIQEGPKYINGNSKKKLLHGKY